MCDPNQMESALLNLCVNARDAMPHGGWLTISTSEVILAEADLAWIRGCSARTLLLHCCVGHGHRHVTRSTRQAFEPFFTTKPAGQGVGLGLSQIYGFVRQSGGIVQMDTALGKGTTVRLCLPAPRRRKIYSERYSDTGKTIMLVEDEESCGKSRPSN